MKKVKIKLYDAFTDRTFGGNIAGVVTKADNLTSNEMQKIASEIRARQLGLF